MIGLISASILNQYCLYFLAKAAGVQYLCKQGRKLVYVTIKKKTKTKQKGNASIGRLCNNTEVHKTVFTLAYKKELSEDFHSAPDMAKER